MVGALAENARTGHCSGLSVVLAGSKPCQKTSCTTALPPASTQLSAEQVSGDFVSGMSLAIMLQYNEIFEIFLQILVSDFLCLQGFFAEVFVSRDGHGEAQLGHGAATAPRLRQQTLALSSRVISAVPVMR